MRNVSSQTVDVCLVGYGPTGVTLANLLGGLGCSVIAVDRQTVPYDLPRAVHFDAEVMRVFQAIGLADAILPTTHVSPGMHFIDSDGNLLIDWSRPMGVGPYGWPQSFRFHQPQLEEILREGAKRYASVQAWLGYEFTGALEEADGVTVTFAEVGGGATKTLRCRYLIGADGARSKVRDDLIGTDWHDLQFNQNWLVADVLLTRPKPELGDYSVQYCDPQQPATYVRGTGDRRRWEVALLPSENPETVTEPDSVWARLARWVSPQDAVLERAAAYTFRSLVNRHWRKGRIFIAGDAAHLTPPFLGQGLCAGIRDAANLAWKLAAVLKSALPDAVLDSYESERIPHVTEYVRQAVRLGDVITTSSLKAVAGQASVNGSLKISSIAPALGPGLGGGWQELRGRPAPQFTLASGQRSDDQIGYHFALMQHSGDQVSSGPYVALQDPAIDPWLDSIGARAVLVRPDRYIHGAARNPLELQQLLSTTSL